MIYLVFLTFEKLENLLKKDVEKIRVERYHLMKNEKTKLFCPHMNNVMNGDMVIHKQVTNMVSSKKRLQ